MESTIEIDQVKANSTDNPVLYTATGWVAGTYQPSPDKFYQGVLVTQDGQEFGAELLWRLRNQLKRKHPGYAEQSDFFLESARWMVYPSTDPLRFRLVSMKPLHSTYTDSPDAGAEPGSKKKLDLFRMVGEIESCAGGTVTICIRRNEQPRRGKEDDPEYQPFVLTLVGSAVPKEAIGQIWELEVRRDGQMLVVVAGRPYEPRKEDLAWIQKLEKQHSTAKKATGYCDKPAVARATPLPSPVIKPKPPGQTSAQEQAEQPIVDATDALPVRSAVASIPEARETPEYPPASPNADISPTAGKMEVVVKLNQFPDDVKTVDKGWKEFSVDADGCIVTITVKPKMFAALEQAQQTYPSWIAAISGQMGAPTATGFLLESPAIKVFERQCKNSSQPEETTSKGSSPQCPTPGKMELIVKFNQFPNDVRTVDSGLKEFGVDTGQRIVTITVKPKAFAALKQAQQTYPLWIAAISGQMGSATTAGFLLESPALKVFERKAKDTSQSEEDTRKDSPSQPRATEAQFSPPAPNPTQRPAALHKQGLQQASSPANPTASIKQSGLSKTTPPAVQQQRATSDQASRPQSASPTSKAETTSKRLDQKPGQKQSTASTPLSESESGKPAFKVKVNDQIFTGRDSVTLNQRVVRIDGKPVGQAKMVIVLGQPRTMQADGGVSQGRNQAVLTSR